MQARFNIERERENTLFYKSYKNDRCILQFHSQIELYFVDEGEMQMTVGGKSRVLRKGEISCSFRYAPHAYKSLSETRSRALLIPLNMCGEFVSLVAGKRPESPFVTDPEVAREISGFYEGVVKSEGNKLKQLGYIQLILGTLVEHLSLLPSDGSWDADLGMRMLYYINDNYKSGISSSSVAQHFGYNQSYVSRYFKAAFGTTVSKYITTVRLRSVASMITEERCDVTTAALESGFPSMRTFYRSFFQEFGCSPKEYIKSINNG